MRKSQALSLAILVAACVLVSLIVWAMQGREPEQEPVRIPALAPLVPPPPNAPSELSQRQAAIYAGTAPPWTIACISCGMGHSEYLGEYIDVVAIVALPPETDVAYFEGIMTARIPGGELTQIVGLNLSEDVANARELGRGPMPSERVVFPVGIAIPYDDANPLHRDLRYAAPEDVEVEFELIEWRAAGE